MTTEDMLRDELHRAAATIPDDDTPLERVVRQGRRRRQRTRGTVAAGVVAVVIAVGLGTTVLELPGSSPLAIDPAPGQSDIVRADEPREIGDVDAGELVAPVHAVTTTCDPLVRDFPSSSTYHVVTDTVSSVDGPTACDARPLSDGRLIVTLDVDTEEPSVGIIDPRRPGDGPQPAPAALDDDQVVGFTGSGLSVVVGFVDDTSEALIARPEDGAGPGLVAVDVDTGDEREVLAPGVVGDADSVIAAAHVRDGHLVVVTAGPLAIGRDVIASMDQTGTEATRIWFGPLDGAIEMVRQPLEQPSGDEFETLDLHPPRILDGPDGPVVASFERQIHDVWQLVLTAPDGASQVAAELGTRVEPVRSTADPRPPRPSRFSQSGTGIGFDAMGSQVIVAGLTADGAAENAEPIPTVLLLDLDDGSWSRLPVNATIATFDRTEQ